MWIFKYILQFFKRKNVEPNECDFTTDYNLHVIEELVELKGEFFWKRPPEEE